MSSRQTTRKRLPDQPLGRPLSTTRGQVRRRSLAGSPAEEDETAPSRRPNARSRRRRARGGPLWSRKMSKETSQWVFAGVVFVGVMLAVIVGIHVIGGTSTPRNAFASRTPGSFFGGRGGGGGGQNTQVLAAVAGVLNLSTISLAADLQAGQTVPQIAAAQNVSMTTVDAAYLGAAEQEFNSFAASGRITQAQVSQLYSQQEQDVQNGQFPLLQFFAQPSATATP